MQHSEKLRDFAKFREGIADGSILPPASLSFEMEFIWLCGQVQMEWRAFRKYGCSDYGKISRFLTVHLMTRFGTIHASLVPWLVELGLNEGEVKAGGEMTESMASYLAGRILEGATSEPDQRPWHEVAYLG